jgi:transcriptional regulator of met regulon
VQTLEILSDLRDEVERQVRSLDGVRRHLVEIALLESSVGQALRILEPLTQLADLRRLGESEVPDAARLILERRTARLSSHDADPQPGPGDAAPRPERLADYFDDEMLDRLVPPPVLEP